MEYKSKIITFCNSIGLDTVGFSRCRVFEELKPYFEERKSKDLENEFEEKDIEKRINPFGYMKEGKTIISIAFPYLYDLNHLEKIGFSKYTFGLDYHKVLSTYLKKICEYIEGLGGKAMQFVDSNALPERYIAYKSGIGFIGKNNMIITEKYGSFIFLGEIITDLYIEESGEKESLCGACDLCLKECPTKAINGKENISNICMSYITQKKNIEDYWFPKFQGRIFGCDSCQNICPFNKTTMQSNIREFEPNEFMKKVDLEELINIDNRIFKEKYANTSCGWRGKNVLQRNALINAVTLQQGEIKGLKKINSLYVEEYYHRLLNTMKL